MLKVAPKGEGPHSTAAAPAPAAPAAPQPAGDYRAEWRRTVVVLAIGVAALIAIFSGTAGRMVSLWWLSPTFNHGFLIVPICCYLAWLRKDHLVTIRPEPTVVGVVLAAGFAFGWLLGEIASVEFVEEVALVCMIQAYVIAVVGLPAARTLAFPLFYLLFAVPAGDFMIAPLQDFTAEFAVQGLRFFGIPVYLDGTFLSIPTGNFEVAEACAGVRFLIATVALGFLYANLTYRETWRRVLFIALSVVVPIVANGIRAFGIVTIAYLSNHKLAVGVDHIVYGWIFFAIVTVLLLSCGLLFRERTADPVRPPHPAATTAPPGPARTVLVPALVLAVAAAAPGFATASGGRSAPPRGPLVLPAPGGAWHPVAASGGWAPSFPGADATARAAYGADGRTVEIFVAYYARQHRGGEVVGFDNAISTDPKKIRVGTGSMTATVDGSPMSVEYSRFLGPKGGQLVWQWYWVDGTFTAGPYLAKVLQARARLLGGTPAAAVVLVSTDYAEQPQQAVATLGAFLRDMAPIRPALEEAAGQ